MNPAAALTGLLAKARADGIWSALSLAYYRLTVRRLEWRIGIETESIVSAEELSFTNPDFRPYAPTDYRYIRRAFRLLNISEDDVLLDIGCGFGRVILFAAKFYSFHKVIGLDISTYMTAVAKENRAKAIGRLNCKNVEIIARDATLYDIPDDVTVIYFFNPFAGEALTKVFEAIRNSMIRKNRSIRLLCLYPRLSSFAEQLPSQHWLVREREIALSTDMRCTLFSVRYANEAGPGASPALSDQPLARRAPDP
jgi:SAM-dependent methyltransferase